MLVILDRYVGRAFAAYFIVCLLGGIGVFMVIDVGTQLEQFYQAGLVGMITAILKYVVWNVPVVICMIFPPLLLISAGWALVQLARNNELIAIKASGISVYRIIIPVLVSGLIMGAIVAAMQEWLIPVLAPGIKAACHPGGTTMYDMAGWIPNTDVSYRMAKYDFIKKEMIRPVFCVWSEGRTIEAGSGACTGGKWRLRDVVINAPGAEGGNGNREVRQEYDLEFQLLPDDIVAQVVDPGFRSSRELIDLVGRHPADLRLRVALHSRIAYPFTGIVLLLIGLPFVIGFERVGRSRILGLGTCFVICAGFYAVTFLCNSLGASDYLPAPWMAAWLPIILFAAAGIFLFDMIKT